MPLKASIGLSRKIGQENYGSLGANCQLEIELDASLIGDAEAFNEKIRQLYALANQAVNDQLAGKTNGNNGNSQANLNRNGNGNGNGAQPSNGHNGNGSNGGNDSTPASNKQIKYLLDIARQRHDMNLRQTADYCEQEVGVSDVYQLSKSQASVIIDRLTGKNGKPTNGWR